MATPSESTAQTTAQTGSRVVKVIPSCWKSPQDLLPSIFQHGIINKLCWDFREDAAWIEFDTQYCAKAACAAFATHQAQLMKTKSVTLGVSQKIKKFTSMQRLPGAGPEGIVQIELDVDCEIEDAQGELAIFGPVSVATTGNKRRIIAVFEDGRDADDAVKHHDNAKV